MANDRGLTIGFPRMYNEPGERRAFLPPLIGLLADMDVDVYVEAGSGAGMGYPDDGYLAVSPRVHIVDEATAYRQDIVVVLRAPEGRYELLRPGAILLSMLHFTTRPERVELLRGLGIEAIALDMVTGDDGRRLVQNLRDVARNGLAAAFDALERRWPPCSSPERDPPSASRSWARAGSASTPSSGPRGAATTRATRGSCARACPGSRSWWSSRTCPATRPTSGAAWHRPTSSSMPRRDATRRVPCSPTPGSASCPPTRSSATWRSIRTCSTTTRRSCAGIEGIPQGNLDQWEFGPDDPAWDRLPPGIPTGKRRTVVSCYSWPGVQPEACMEAYGSQVTPLLKTLIWYGGLPAIGPGVSFHGRALWRGSLRHWLGEDPVA